MDPLGHKLRAARLARSLTLEAISAQTRISLRYLQAIEADEPEAIGSRTYFKSFARQYASALGLSAADVDAGIEALAAHIPQALMPGENGAPAPSRIRPSRSFRLSPARWMASWGLTAGALVLCSMFYAHWNTSRQTVAAGHGEVAGIVRAAPSGSAQPIAVAAAGSVHIELAAKEPTWLDAVADGKPIFSGTLQPKQKEIVDSNANARVRIGNAGGLTIAFNGKELGSVGRKGQVETLIFDRDGYRQEGAQPLAFAAISPALER